MSSADIEQEPDAPSEFSARVATWWAIFKINFNEKLVYRGDFMLGTLMRFLPIVTQIFLWYAIFSTIDDPATGEPSDNSKIVGYTYINIVGYYLLSTITRAFSSMPGLASGIAAFG